VELDFTLEQNIVDYGTEAEVRWCVVRKSDDVVMGEYPYLYLAEEDVVRRTLATFLLGAVQQALDTDEGEAVWEALTEFMHYSTVQDRCSSCDQAITNSLPAAAQLMADSLVGGQAAVDRAS